MTFTRGQLSERHSARASCVWLRVMRAILHGEAKRDYMNEHYESQRHVLRSSPLKASVTLICGSKDVILEES